MCWVKQPTTCDSSKCAGMRLYVWLHIPSALSESSELQDNLPRTSLRPSGHPRRRDWCHENNRCAAADWVGDSPTHAAATYRLFSWPHQGCPDGLNDVRWRLSCKSDDSDKADGICNQTYNRIPMHLEESKVVACLTQHIYVVWRLILGYHW